MEHLAAKEQGDLTKFKSRELPNEAEAPKVKVPQQQLREEAGQGERSTGPGHQRLQEEVGLVGESPVKQSVVTDRIKFYENCVHDYLESNEGNLITGTTGVNNGDKGKVTRGINHDSNAGGVSKNQQELDREYLEGNDEYVEGNKDIDIGECSEPARDKGSKTNNTVFNVKTHRI